MDTVMRCVECHKKGEQFITMGICDNEGKHFTTECPHCGKVTERIQSEHYALGQNWGRSLTG